jgi:cytochrome b561
MRWKSSGDRYGAVAIAIHWLTAFAVIGLLTSGLIVAGLTDSEAKASILSVHVPMGVLVLTLTVARIVWWLGFDRRPAVAEMKSQTQAALARFTHLAFYPLLIALGASGVALIALSGAASVLFFSAAGPLPDFWQFAPRAPHMIFAYALIALVALHVAAALFHQFAKQDGLLARMGLFAWPRKSVGAGVCRSVPAA